MRKVPMRGIRSSSSDQLIGRVRPAARLKQIPNRQRLSVRIAKSRGHDDMGVRP
jgi:hypothetical protein